MINVTEKELYHITPRLWEIARSNNLPKSTVYGRFYRGWTPYDCVAIPRYGRRDNPEEQTYRAKALENGIPLKCYRNRIARGYKLEEAATLPQRTRRKKELIWK